MDTVAHRSDQLSALLSDRLPGRSLRILGTSPGLLRTWTPQLAAGAPLCLSSAA
jgi:hypothetical protein